MAAPDYFHILGLQNVMLTVLPPTRAPSASTRRPASGTSARAQRARAPRRAPRRGFHARSSATTSTAPCGPPAA